MLSKTTLERIYRRLLREGAAPTVNGYGAVVFSSGISIVTVIYDVPTLEDTLLDEFSGVVEDEGEVMDVEEAAALVAPSIVGYVNITEPGNPCWGAYSIAMAAGPGKLVYGAAYATSPTKLIISDRTSMTPKAIGAWKGMAEKGTRRKKKLDNVWNPQTPEEEDDCALREEEFLNYAYEAEGGEEEMLEEMKAEHNALKARLMKAVGPLARFAERSLRGALRAAGRTFFDNEHRRATSAT